MHKLSPKTKSLKDQHWLFPKLCTTLYNAIWCCYELLSLCVVQEVMVLENRLRVKTAELANLQKKVHHLLTEPLTTHTSRTPSSSSSLSTSPHHLNNTSLFKENIIPK